MISVSFPPTSLFLMQTDQGCKRATITSRDASLLLREADRGLEI